MGNRVGLLLIGGNAPEAAPILRGDRDALLIIAADSGLHHADRYRWHPDVLVGDFDSLDPDLLRRGYRDVPREQHDTAKDFTDTEIGLRYLWKHGVEEIVIIGGGGGRLDHVLGLVALFDRPRYPQRWITEGSDARILDCTVEITGKPGEIVSFFPFGSDTCHMRTRGLRWELNDLQWKKGDAGVSNEFVGDVCRVEVLSGRLLMVRALKQPPVLP